MDDQRNDPNGGGSMRFPQVSLKRFFASAILIGTGVALAASAYQQIAQRSALFDPFAITVIWLIGGVLAGAGLLLPFRRAAIGALLGFVYQGLIIAIVTQLKK